MGQGMPKAVTSVVVKRWGGKPLPFRVGLAEMNGWRPSMEDAHVVVMQDSWGFFGVLDGHGGSQCSAYIAERLTKELQTNGKPEDDAAMTELALKLDKEYLESGQPSGSTGTFVIITTPATADGTYDLRVGNIGDSRVLLGRNDGTMVEGDGTDGGLTTDHKPDYPDERSRIERTGGHVQEVMGVHRVNGDLAVSRAFGDAQYKQTGGPDQRDHPVTAAPEHCRHECSGADFLLLVCDGISESNFPNREVVQLASQEIQKFAEASADGAVDPGMAAAAVCRKALERGSKDNLSCMIVLLGERAAVGKERELLPGAADSLNHEGFRKAYEAMADHAGMTLVEAVEARYVYLQEELEKEPPNASQLKDELNSFKDGPPKDCSNEERMQWFEKWVTDQKDPGGDGDRPEISDGNLVRMMQDPEFLRMAQRTQPDLFQAVIPDTYKPPSEREPVVAAGEDELRQAITQHFALQWDTRYLSVCGKEGIILKRDDSDKTSQVRFYMEKSGPMTAWFPDATLAPPLIKVADLDSLKSNVERNDNVDWNDLHSKVQDAECDMLKIDDEKEAVLIRVPDTTEEVWIPNGAWSRITATGASATEAGTDL